MKIGLEEPEGLLPVSPRGNTWRPRCPSYQQRAIYALFTQINDKLLECHGFIVDGYNEVAELRQEELNLLVAELPQLGAQDIVDAHVLGIPTALLSAPRSLVSVVLELLRKVGDGQGRVSVEVLGLDEALEQVPAVHGGRRRKLKSPTYTTNDLLAYLMEAVRAV